MSRRGASRATSAVLGAAVREDGRDQPVRRLFERCRGDELVRRARLHRVSPLVHRLLEAHGIAGPAVEALALDRRRAMATHMRTLADLAHVGDALDAAGIPWLALKGPVLVETAYRAPDLRPYSDLDVLVSGADLADALGALEQANCSVVDRNWTLMRRLHLGEVHVESRFGTLVDLHWHLLNQPWLRDRFELGGEVLFERSTGIRIDGRHVMVLDPTDALVHVLTHAALAGGDRLVWMKDVDVLVRNGVRWDELVRRAIETRTALPVAAMLSRARTTTGVEVPADVLGALAGRGWRSLFRLVDARSPVATRDGGPSLARVTARSLRDASLATSLELVRRSAAAAVATVSDPDRRGRESGRDPASPSSVLHPSGGPEVRDAYLSDVAAAAG